VQVNRQADVHHVHVLVADEVPVVVVHVQGRDIDLLTFGRADVEAHLAPFPRQLGGVHVAEGDDLRVRVVVIAVEVHSPHPADADEADTNIRHEFYRAFRYLFIQFTAPRRRFPALYSPDARLMPSQKVAWFSRVPRYRLPPPGQLLQCVFGGDVGA